MSDMDRTDELVEYRRKYRDALTQLSAEGWIDVVRDGDDEIEARPIDRQDDRDEGERIESDTWLIRENNGETYVIDGETFESEFTSAGRFHERQFCFDLSWDDHQPDDGSGPTVSGATARVFVTATIDVSRDSVISMEVNGVEYQVGDETTHALDAIPMEMIYDSDKVYDVEDGFEDDDSDVEDEDD